MEVILFILFIVFFLIGFYIIHRQVALVKKGEFNLNDRLQCIIYGIIFGLAVMVVISMAFIFTIKNPEFWKDSSFPPPELNPLVLLIPFILCLIYVSFYPLIDFLFIALSGESDEGLTAFHKLIGRNFINKFDNKLYSVIMAVVLYIIFAIPPIILSFLGLPLIMIWISWMLVYPLMILTFFGSKGYIAGISNCYYHIPNIHRSVFLNFENSKRGMKQFASDPGPYILIGLMLFVYVWAWFSMFQTLAFFFTGTIAISTMSSVFVFVTLLFGIIGYFTRFWGRKIKYRGIDIYFAAYLMAAIGINVLINFLIVNPHMLIDTFDTWFITNEIVPNYRLFAWAAAIEETVLIIFTTYFFLARNSKFTTNLQYSKITECGRTFDPVPLFNFIGCSNYRIRSHAEETLLLMYERIPFKTTIDLNNWKYKDILIDGICSPNLTISRLCYSILIQLERDAPNIVLQWIIEGLESPNYDKSIPFAKSLMDADSFLIEKIPKRVIYNLINDSEWQLRLYGFQLLSKLSSKNPTIIQNIDTNKLFNDPESKIQVELLKTFANLSLELPINILIDKLNHSNDDIRAAAIKNVKNLTVENFDSRVVSKIIPQLKDPASSVRASIFEVFGKIGNFKEYHIPVAPFIDGLIDSNESVRTAAISALDKYFNEEPETLNFDDLMKIIDPNNYDVLNSVLTLLGRLWDKNPENILSTLLDFIKVEDEKLKENISGILIEKYKAYPDLILQNLIRIPEDTTFITKGIITKTIIKIVKSNPTIVIPELILYLQSGKNDIRLNAIISLEGLVDQYFDLIEIKQFLLLLQSNSKPIIKKYSSKIISKIAKKNPMSIRAHINEIIQSIDIHESSVKITLSKSLLEIAKSSPDLIPIDLIAEFLDDKDSFIRESGAKILGFVNHQNPEESAKVLINRGLVDEEWIVREAAVTSLGKIVKNIANKEEIIVSLVKLLDDEQGWVRRSAISILSEMREVTASKIPFEKIYGNLNHEDPKVREASTGLLKIYGLSNIDRIFDKITMLLEDESEDVRKSMRNTMIEIIQKIGIKTLLSKILKNLSDESSIKLQHSIALILRRTVKYEDEKIKKRVISLLKIRCEMSQDPIICETLQHLKES